MSLARDTADYGHIKTARKNLLINGDFDIAQRGASFVAHTAGDYTLDRWFATHVGAMVYSCFQLGTSSDLPFRHYHRIDVTTADATMAAGDVTHLTQKIEGYNIHYLNWGQASAKDLTISFWHRHTKTGTQSVAFRNSAGDRCYVAEYTQSVTNEWEYAEVTIPGCTDGTWLEDANVGLSVSFAAACGSTYTGTPGSWISGTNTIASTNQVNNMDNVNNVFDIAHVQLEAGTQATDWDFRDIGTELAACQRYYQKLFFVNYRPFGIGRTAGSGTLLGATQTLITEMRAAPTVSNTSNGMSRTRTSDFAGTAITAATDFFVASGTRQIHLEIASEGTTNETYAMVFQTDTSVYCDAEF